MNATFAAAPGETVKLLDVAAVSLPSVALSVYAPARLNSSLLNVATPLTARTVEIAPAVPPVGTVAVEIVTFDVSVSTTLPNLSSTLTVTDGDTFAPAVALDGPWPKTSCVATFGEIVNESESADVSVPSVNVR